MRRDTVTLDVANVSWLADEGDPRRPLLVIHVDDGDAALRERLHVDGRPVDPDDIDVTVRFQGSSDDDAGDSVLAITNRVTGEFLLEVNTDTDTIVEFVTAARRYAERTGDTTRYRTRVVEDDESLADVEKRTLLVYSSGGELLRQHSLIPSGVEI